MPRVLGYVWALPMTCVGLIPAAVGALSGGGLTIRDGVIEAQGGLLRSLLRRGAAMTLGHVILARDEACLERSRRHERVHVLQFEQWGPLLLPASWVIAAWLRWRGFDPYLDHPFENDPREPRGA